MKIDRLHGVAIKEYRELQLGDTLLYRPTDVFDALTVFVTKLEWVGDDVVVNDTITSSESNKVIVLDDSDYSEMMHPTYWEREKKWAVYYADKNLKTT